MTSWGWARYCSKHVHVEDCNKCIKHLCIKLVIGWGYTKMDGQRNIKKYRVVFFFILYNEPTKAELFHKSSHSYMFRHYRAILRELVSCVTWLLCTFSSHIRWNVNWNNMRTFIKPIRNIIIVNCITNSCIWNTCCNVARYWLQAPWGWHDSV